MGTSHLALQPSEVAVYQVAGQIFAAALSKSDLDEIDEEILINRAVQLAIRLAEKTDDMVRGEREIG